LPHDLGAKILIVIVGKRHPLIAPSGEGSGKSLLKREGYDAWRRSKRIRSYGAWKRVSGY
jgi:hypothetical protein